MQGRRGATTVVDVLNYLPVLIVIALVLIAWGWTHRSDGRTLATFDCGRDDCRWRGRVSHRHSSAVS